MGNDNDGGERTGTDTGWNEQKPNTMLTMSEEWTISDVQNLQGSNRPFSRAALPTTNTETRKQRLHMEGEREEKTCTLHNAHSQKQTLP